MRGSQMKRFTGRQMGSQGWSWLVVSLVIAMALTGCRRAARADATIDELMARSDGGEEVRLPRFVQPTHYDLVLQVDPERPEFSGEVTITIDVMEKSSSILLHAQELDVEEATLFREEKSSSPGAELQVTRVSRGLVKLEGARPFERGERYKISMRYRGVMDEEPSGLYRTRDGEDWYAVTQFEPLEARKAFPCFDEPGFKATFSVTIDVPQGQVAAANAGLVSKENLSRETTRYVFGKTRPIPSYLVAMTVGPYEVVQGSVARGDEGMEGPEFRVLVPAGKGALARYAVEKTPAILASLEDYFGQAYPFAKLDFVAVPNFSAGAMENVGLVTYRDSILLIDSDAATPSQKSRLLNIVAHELAHMWFGNLITPEWWDDLWLNESFATWMANRVVEELAPELDSGLYQVMWTEGLMRADSLVQSRAIRQPIQAPGDVYNAFNGMTYGKGARILRMTEGWLGEKSFRQGIRNLMQQQAYGSVTSQMLWDALKTTSGKDVEAMMRTFIDQPGVPLVEVTPLCSGEAAQYRLRQSRYAPSSSELASKKRAEALWRVPICVSYATKEGGAVSRHCELLTEQVQIMTLPGVEGCPVWLHPNAEEQGYYHWSLPAADLLALSKEHRQKLSLREQLGLLGHLNALVAMSKLESTTLYEVAREMTTSQNSLLVSEALDVFLQFAGLIQDEPSYRGAYGRMLRELLWPQLERLGLEPITGEIPADSNLRGRVLSLLGSEAMDAAVLANARQLMLAFLEDPDAYPPEKHWALDVAATQGDAILWGQVVEALDRAKTPSSRGAVLSALGHFREPALLEQSVNLYLTDEVRSNEFWALVGPNSGDRALVEAVLWPWLKTHYDQLTNKLGVAFGAPSLPYVASGMCDLARVEEVRHFFEEEVQMVEGMKTNLEKMLERMEQCVTRRALSKSEMKTFLDPWRR